MRQRLLLLLLLALLPLARAALTNSGPSDAAPFPLADTIPTTNPYRAPLLRYDSLSPENRKLIDDWLSPLDDATPPTLAPAQATLVKELTAALVSAAAAPSTTIADWALVPDPTDPDDLPNATIPTLGSIRTLARIATKTAKNLPPSEAVATYAAVAQLGRQQRVGQTSLHQLTGVAIEHIALDGAAQDLQRLSPAELRQLSAAWAGLQPQPSIECSLAGEREVYFKPIIERTLLPGLRELLAEESLDTTAADQPDGTSTFTRDLRLSGLLDLGNGERRIILENTVTHTVLNLRENQTIDGITLTGINIEKRLAFIRHRDREAVIHLESKKIVERSRAIERLRAIVGRSSLPLPGHDSATNETQSAWLNKIRDHPGGPEGYAKDLLAIYDQYLTRHINAAAQTKATIDTTQPPTDPFLIQLMPPIGGIARILNGSAAASVMLQAAIHHRLVALGAAVDHLGPSDPWAGEEGADFLHEPASDGGFLLRSRYEMRPGAPYTYKFAAPDAGYVRPSTP